MEFLVVLALLWLLWLPFRLLRGVVPKRPPNKKLMNEVVEVDRLKHDATTAGLAETRRREYQAAVSSKRAIEEGIARHGIGTLGLTLQDIREAEEELRRAGVEDWRIHIR